MTSKLIQDVKIALEQDGYTTFITHSEQADLIAISIDSYTSVKDTGTYPIVKLIQCKRHRNLMTSKEIKTFYEFAKALGCGSWIAWRDRGIHLQEIVV